jgi:hypothetical protein
MVSDYLRTSGRRRCHQPQASSFRPALDHTRRRGCRLRLRLEAIDRDLVADLEGVARPSLLGEFTRTGRLQGPITISVGFSGAHLNDCVRIAPIDPSDLTLQAHGRSGIELSGERMMG